MRCDLTQRLLRPADFLQQPHRVEVFKLRLQPHLDRRLNAGVRQHPITGGRRCEVDFVYLGAIATLRFEGQGGAAGHGKGHAEIRLEATGPRETVLHYTAHATVGGKIAQIGSRLVDMAAQKMATDFFETFNARLQERYAVVAAPVPAVPAAPQGLLARLLAWIKRLAGG